MIITEKNAQVLKAVMPVKTVSIASIVLKMMVSVEFVNSII
jgi:hypothetical protein